MIVTIEKIVPGGDGMGRVDGKVVFLPLALPGETHRIRVVGDKKGFLRGESEEILDRGAGEMGRNEPFCPLFGRCGGCNMQHLSYDDQLRVKADMAMDCLARQGGDELASRLEGLPEVVASPDKGYRNRAQFHRRGDLTGFLARGSHDLVPLSHCPLLAKGINDYLARAATGAFPPKERFSLFGEGDNCWVEGIHGKMEVTLLGRKILSSPRLFFQSNLTLFPRLIRDVLEFAGKGESFADLYSGVGVFALFLEDSFERGTAVESSRGALDFARRNLRRTEFFEEPVEKWVRGGKGESPDFLVVDPPRTGLSRTAREAILELKPLRLSYVSCDPVTQARDLKELTRDFYRLAGYRIYDFYPQTSHMESLAHLELIR